MECDRQPSLGHCGLRVGRGVLLDQLDSVSVILWGFLEPVRLDFHAPTNAPTWAKIVVFRAGLLVFPGGFDTNAFAPRPEVAHRISRDWVKTFSIYTDLEQVLNLVNKH